VLDEFIDFLKTNLKARRLEELSLPLVVTATDLDHGSIVHFTQGNLAERIAASCCMPVLFSPVRIEGTHYVDGGLFMNLPVTPIRKACDKVVAINVSPLNADQYKMNIVSIAMRSYNFMFRANSLAERRRADLLIEPYHLDRYSNRELEKAEEIFEVGYNTAFDTLNQLRLSKGDIWKALKQRSKQ
jgi:NTE family protein